MFRVAMLTALACVLAACATTKPDPNYQAYVEFQRDAQAEADARRAAIADTTDCKGDATCIVATKALAAMAEVGGGGGARGAALQPFQKQPSTLDRILGIAQAVIVPGMSAYVSLKQSDNARDISLAQYDFLGNVAQTAGDTAVRLAESGPRIEVGGNFGDTYGAEFTGGDRTDVGGDAIDAGDNVNIGEGNRIGSPGPIANECAGGAGAEGGDGGETGNGGNGAPGGACSNGNGG